MNRLVAAIRDRSAFMLRDSSAAASIVATLTDVINSSPLGGPRTVTTLTVEQGFIKVLVACGPRVVSHHIALANHQFFREGLISDAGRVATIIQKAVTRAGGESRYMVGAVPGYQSTLRHMGLPVPNGLNPEAMIFREARRVMGVSPETSHLAWHRLADGANWVVISATRRSMASLLETVSEAGLEMRSTELRSFALARAVGKRDAIIAWIGVEACEVVVVRASTPVVQQSDYWGSEPIDRGVLVDRVAAVVERSVAAYDEQGIGMPMPLDTPLYVTGSPVGVDQGIAHQIAVNLARPLETPHPHLEVPPDFPTHDMIVNIGLALGAIR